jgi:U3 small nucleolar RNA-associated protein 13
MKKNFCGVYLPHAFFFWSSWQFLMYGIMQIVNVWDMRKYSSKKTIPTYEMIEAVSFIGLGSEFLACLGIEPANINGKTDGYFLTVGERGVVRVWSLERFFFAFKIF